MVNCFNQVLRLRVVIAWAHDIVSVSGVGPPSVGSNLNSWVILQGLSKTPVGDVIEEGRGECTSLSNLKGTLTVVLGYHEFGIHRLGNGLNIY